MNNFKRGIVIEIAYFQKKNRSTIDQKSTRPTKTGKDRSGPIIIDQDQKGRTRIDHEVHVERSGQIMTGQTRKRASWTRDDQSGPIMINRDRQGPINTG